MHRAKTTCRAACAALAALLLTSGGSVAMVAAPQAAGPRVVTNSELYDAMSERTDGEAALRESVQKLLERAEVLRAAADAGVDLARVRAYAALLSGEDLRVVADQAQRLDQALAGGTAMVISSTAAVIFLLVIILLIQAK